MRREMEDREMALKMWQDTPVVESPAKNLGIEEELLPLPRYRRTHFSQDLKIWSQKPLPPHLILMAAPYVLYLSQVSNTVSQVLPTHWEPMDEGFLSG